MKKVISLAVMAVGVVLLLATESENGISNMIGLSMVWYEAQEMGLFYK
jgi:hypothetical protein